MSLSNDSLIDALDIERNNVLKDMISPDEGRELASEFNDIYQSLVSEVDRKEDLSQAEKAYLFLNDVGKHKLSKLSDLEIRSVAYKGIYGVDIEKALMTKNTPSEDNKIMVLIILGCLFADDEEKELFKTSLNISDAQFNSVMDKLEQMLEEDVDEAKSAELEAIILRNVNSDKISFYRNLSFHAFVAFLKNIDILGKVVPSKDPIIEIKAIQRFVGRHMTLFNEWRSYINENVHSQVFSRIFADDNFSDVNSVLGYFTDYYIIKQLDGGKSFIEDVNKLCESPKDKKQFVDMVKKHEFGMAFCNEYLRLCGLCSIDPIFDVNKVINGVNLIYDKDNTRGKEWFVRIPEDRIAGSDGKLADENRNALFYRNLSSLYDDLSDYATITNDQRRLFIYRLSGVYEEGCNVNEEFNPNFKMEWTWKRKQFLPVLAHMLFESEDGFVPQMAVVRFFGLTDSNGMTSLWQRLSSKRFDEYKCLLENCGFTVPDYVKKKFDDIHKTRKDDAKRKKDGARP